MPINNQEVRQALVKALERALKYSSVPDAPTSIAAEAVTQVAALMSILMGEFAFHSRFTEKLAEAVALYRDGFCPKCKTRHLVPREVMCAECISEVDRELMMLHGGNGKPN